MTSFSSADPRTGEVIRTFQETPLDVVGETVREAARAFERARKTSAAERARMLRAAADALDGARAEIIATADQETALGEARLQTELPRTTGQLRMFADLLEEGSFVEAVIDHARPDLAPSRPDLRRMLIPLGPVANFAASNFPLAFSVPGGDTASALAAGCPVVVKAHPSHPQTSQLCFGLLKRALTESGAPDGMIGLVEGASNEVGAALVTAPEIKAVAFTGSLRGGRALYDLAATREEPIPVYAEMGSLNPLVVTERALDERMNDVAQGFAASMTQGMGQFCTKPGLAFAPAGVEGDRFCQVAAEVLASTAGTALLNQRMRDSLARQVERTAAQPGVVRLLGGRPSSETPGFLYPATLMTCDASTFLSTPDLSEEHFGPFGLVVRYRSAEEMLDLAWSLRGNLTATIHAGADEADELGELAVALAQRVGRLIWNGYPTGVAVTHAMHHGGPYPATTAPLHTSVGTAAIKRFLRPVVYQSIPADLLPAALQEDNPLGILRLVDGDWVR